MSIGLRMQCLRFLLDPYQILIRLFSPDLQTILKYKFYETVSCGSQVVLCARTDMKKSTVAFRNIVTARKKEQAKQCTYNVTEVPTCNHCCSRKTQTLHFFSSIAGMPPHHWKKNSSNFIIGIFTLPEDGQVMTETCRSYSKF